MFRRNFRDRAKSVKIHLKVSGLLIIGMLKKALASRVFKNVKQLIFTDQTATIIIGLLLLYIWQTIKQTAENRTKTTVNDTVVASGLLLLVGGIYIKKLVNAVKERIKERAVAYGLQELHPEEIEVKNDLFYDLHEREDSLAKKAYRSTKHKDLTVVGGEFYAEYVTYSGDILNVSKGHQRRTMIYYSVLGDSNEIVNQYQRLFLHYMSTNKLKENINLSIGHMERLTEQLVEARGKKGPDGSILLHSLQEYLGVVAALALQLRFFDLDTFKIRVMKRSMIKLGEEKKFEPLANYILHIPHLFGFTGDNYLPKYLEVEIKRRRQLSERNEQYDIVQFILDNPCLFDLNKIESIGYILSLLIHSGTTLLKVYLNKVFLDIALTPGVYEHLYQEQCHIIEEHGKKIELDILDKMEILDSTILESIRLSSHQEWLVRYLNKDFVLSNGVSLHKGTYVSFDMLGHTHNEKIFGKDPGKFNYKRFVRSGPMHQPLGDVSARNLLWGVGPRMCMGKDYSIAIMKLILSIHIRKYAIKPAFLGHKEGDTIHTFKIDKKPSFVYFIPQ